MAPTFYKEAVDAFHRSDGSLWRTLVSDFPIWRTAGSQRRSGNDAHTVSLHRHIPEERPRHRTCLLVFHIHLRTVLRSSGLRLAERVIIRGRREHALFLAFWSHFSGSRAGTLGIINHWTWSNKPAEVNLVIASRFSVGSHGPGITNPDRCPPQTADANYAR